MLSHLAPARDESLVDAVELVGVGMGVLEPVPLDDGGFEQGGRGIGVVLEQLGRPRAVVTQIEAAVERRGILLPAFDDVRGPLFRETEAREEVLANDVLNGL